MGAVHISLDITLINLEKRLERVKIDTCIITLRGDVVFRYFRNKKAINKVFKLHSATKSILSILAGIAIDNGALEGVIVPISRFFPMLSDDKARITVKDLLTMSPGFSWEEFGEWGGRPFPMINSNNWVKFILERPMIEEPGLHMYYNSGCSHLLSAILQQCTGRQLSRFAKDTLFRDLGIDDFIWHSDSTGIGIGGFGLTLKAIDMQKVGRLMLQNGVFHDKQVVSFEWVETSTRRRFHTYDFIGSYGFHWWIMNDDDNTPIHPYTYFAMGYSGTLLLLQN